MKSTLADLSPHTAGLYGMVSAIIYNTVMPISSGIVLWLAGATVLTSWTAILALLGGAAITCGLLALFHHLHRPQPFEGEWAKFSQLTPVSGVAMGMMASGVYTMVLALLMILLVLCGVTMIGPIGLFLLVFSSYMGTYWAIRGICETL